MAAWALAFGCAVGWGSFVMPGTTFLPSAGPLGSVLGLIAGATMMMLIGVNYFQLMKRYPDAGGAYTYAKKVLGFDHGFLCAWMLLLTYIAIIWANSTALALIVRYLFGDLFSFGFTYEIAGYTVHFGEVLLSATLLWAAGLVCALSKRLMKWVQIICAVLLLVGPTAAFIAVTVHNGGFKGIEPLFAQGGEDPAVQVLGMIILAPWAFVGFESISHSAGEFKFSVKKSFPILMASLVTGVLTYIMLVMCASMATPDGYANWTEYLMSLKELKGVIALPTFYSAQQSMGTIGLVTLGIAALCGIITALIANNIALSRLFYSMSGDGMAPKRLGRLNGKGIPATAVFVVTGVSTVIPLLGRTAIGWIVDVTTIGAAIIYAYTSIASFVMGLREKNRRVQVFGVLGTLLAMVFVVFYLLPNFWSKNRLATESYLLLIIWSVLGMVVFRVLIGRDKTRRFGKSEIVWVILLFLILLVSQVWIHQVTVEEAGQTSETISAYHFSQSAQAGLNPDSEVVRTTTDYITNQFFSFSNRVMHSVLVQIVLITVSMSVVFSIFSIIKRREKQIEAERLVAEESSKAKSIFLSNMSHDIRTPMNAITGYTALALKEDDLSDTVRDYLEKIDTSGRHLLSLINDILDMSRIESGKMELDASPASLTALLDEIHSMFVMQMESKKLKFTVDYAGITDKAVICDKHRLNRILLNLLSNACKFTPEGGSVTLTATQTGRDGDTASYELRVADTGIGMSEEFASRVFEAFERENTRTVSQIQGTGLGMSITKSLTELMGGTISVKTKQGEGTEILLCLRFPLADEEALAEAEKSEEAALEVDFTGMRLLLAEDNPINKEIASLILGQEGFAVDTAENGREALEKIQDSPPGTYRVVLMDIQMPEMNGYEATRAIRALPGEQGRIPIIAMTANTFEDDRRAAYEAGMNFHVGKPFKPDELMSAIAAVIKQNQE